MLQFRERRPLCDPFLQCKTRYPCTSHCKITVCTAMLVDMDAGRGLQQASGFDGDGERGHDKVF
jgi:hypothetical protein